MLQKLLFLPMSVVKWIAEVVIEVLQLDKSEAKEREHQILLGIQSSGLALGWIIKKLKLALASNQDELVIEQIHIFIAQANINNEKLCDLHSLINEGGYDPVSVCATLDDVEAWNIHVHSFIQTLK